MITILRNYDTPNDVTPLRSKVDRPSGRMIPIGASIVLKEKFVKAKTAVNDGSMSSMDTS